MNLRKLFMFQYPKSTRFWEFMKNSSIIYTCMILYICIHKILCDAHHMFDIGSSAGFAFWEVTSKGISSAPEDKICFTWQLGQMVQLRESSDANLCSFVLESCWLLTLSFFTHEAVEKEFHLNHGNDKNTSSKDFFLFAFILCVSCLNKWSGKVQSFYWGSGNILNAHRYPSTQNSFPGYWPRGHYSKR